MDDQRLQSLLEWLPVSVIQFEPVAGDASRRRYFRIHTPAETLIAMDAPPPEDPCRFVQIGELMRRARVRVPEIHSLEPSLGFVLLEDFGDRSYLSSLKSKTADPLYQDALLTLLTLQTELDPGDSGLPPYSEDLLRRELEIFHEWLLERWLGLTIPGGMWQATVETLVENALEQPQVCVHRDYHSRNLMVIAGKSPGVLDFQDAVIGPVTYDPVSLLRDCYIAWPEARVAGWCEMYRQWLGNMDINISPQRWLRWFDLMGAQRHLKAAGIFARLQVRDHRSGYLADIPRTLRYVIAVCEAHGTLREFGEWLQNRVLLQVVSRT